jgi:predicted alpha/beta hydrolase family esterase
MKQALLLHGTGGSDTDYFWFADTKAFLEQHGYNVWWPLLPHTEKPNIDETRDFLEDNFSFEDVSEAIFIGHSSACPMLLDFLSNFTTPIKQLVLVSGFYKSLNDDGYSDLMLPEEGFDYVAVRAAAKEIVLINSDNDPWGCDDKQARPIAKLLGAKFILAEGQGHMGSSSFNQAYREFPTVKELLEV